MLCSRLHLRWPCWMKMALAQCGIISCKLRRAKLLLSRVAKVWIAIVWARPNSWEALITLVEVLWHNNTRIGIVILIILRQYDITRTVDIFFNYTLLCFLLVFILDLLDVIMKLWFISLHLFIAFALRPLHLLFVLSFQVINFLLVLLFDEAQFLAEILLHFFFVDVLVFL